MAKSKITLDHKGIAAMLKSQEVAALVHAEAERIASAVRSNPDVVSHEMADDVEVEDYVTDRAASAVRLAHAGALGMEAKYGVISRSTGGTV
ncbi:hypothetical protein [Kribbella sp. CA-293567]|uniref:hypothetical protein n=1 Tax=Kribbella sp. CA-293567 TaxID=3002436 RepID=UPI0022DDC7B9|nr:hypothetical protein [Kribbella sp. CA-293567]WBQ03785.1 hypothetical protein OX958_27925 [Kribbella sp. CA-293567]